MKRLIALMAVLCAAPAFAQTPTPAAAPAPSTVSMTGSVVSGAQVVDTDTNSAKFTEYRDVSDDFVLPRLTFGVADRASGWFFDLRGSNVGRNDQNISMATGMPGRYRFGVTWNETPHHYSSKALTPYINRGGGLLTPRQVAAACAFRAARPRARR